MYGKGEGLVRWTLDGGSIVAGQVRRGKVPSGGTGRSGVRPGLGGGPWEGLMVHREVWCEKSPHVKILILQQRGRSDL